jgi:DNA-binding MurR/RpiR family transcriptional regulator
VTGDNRGFEQVRARVEARFPALSGRLQRAARYVTERPDDVALFSMRTVAQRADVSPATMVRLAKELGYASYNDFRAPFQHWLQTRHFSFAAQAVQVRRSGEGGDVAALIAAIAEREAMAIRSCMAEVDPRRIAEAVQILKSARRIFVAGLRTAYLPAYYFNYASRLYSDKTVLLEGSGGAYADELRFITPRDALLAFVSKPYARATIRAIVFAAGQNARVVTVTDSILSPAVPHSTISITVNGMGPAHFPLIGPTMIAAEVLASLLLVDADDEFLAAIHKAEHQLRSFDVSTEPLNPDEGE